MVFRLVICQFEEAPGGPKLWPDSEETQLLQNFPYTLDISVLVEEKHKPHGTKHLGAADRNFQSKPRALGFVLVGTSPQVD